MYDVGGDTDPLGSLLAAIQAFVSRDPQTLTAFELGEQLIGLRHGIDLLELGFAADAAVFAGTDEYETQGSTSAIDWIRHHCHMSGNAAARAVAAGEQGVRLPESVAALEEGRIGFAHFSLLAGVARSLSKGLAGSGDAGDADADAPNADGESDPALTGTAPRFDERPLLALALEHSVGRFNYDCIHARHAADAAAVLAEHVEGVERRHLELIPCEGGALAVRGFFDRVGGAAIRTTLEALARRTGVGDTRSRPRRLGDAFVELSHHDLDAGCLPGQAGGTHLQLTASVETVMGLVGAPGGDLEYGGAVPAATVQRLACDASIRRVLLGPNAAVIEVGRALRVPGEPARAALRVRDQGCVWPGCERTVAWTTAHHVLHWGHGGDTDLDNLVLLCHRHHWLIHEGGWQLVRSDQGILVVPPNQTHRSWIRAPADAGVD